MWVYGVLVGVLLTCAQWPSGHSAFRQSRPHKGKRLSTYTVDISDDAVLYVAAKEQREKVLGVAPDIPALTDTTFPHTAYNTTNSLVVVLFYLPFDAVGMVFLQQYRQAGRELAALKGGKSSSSAHPLKRVNCHDWTDVCRKENITTYPVIHLYQEGKWRQQYRDALDKDALVRTVFLLQCGQPLWLQSSEEVKRFLTGHLPDNAHPLVDNLVLLKPSASLTEVAAFTEVVRQLETHMLFAILGPHVHTHLVRMEVGVLHVRLGDEYQPYDALTEGLDTESIRHFLVAGKLHMLPELTFRNFPELFSRQRPLAVLFLRPDLTEASLHVHTVVDVIRSRHVHNVTFCTMGVQEDNPMAETLLKTYTGQLAVPAFVIVDFHQHAVFSLTNSALTEKKLIAWILGVQNGRIKPTSHLPRGHWKPAAPHIDFLAKMDAEESQKTQNQEAWLEEEEEQEDFSDNAEKERPENQNQHQCHDCRDSNQYRGQNPNQDQIPTRENQNENHRNEDRHGEDYVRPQNQQTQRDRNQHSPDQKQDTRHQSHHGHDHAQNQHKVNQNRHHNEDQFHHHHHRKQQLQDKNQNQNRNQQNQNQNRNQHNQNRNQQNQNQNRNQQNQNQNQNQQNQNQHRNDQNDNPGNANQNRRNPSRHPQHGAPKLNHNTNLRQSVEELEPNLSRERQNHLSQPSFSRQEGASTFSGGQNSLGPKGERDQVKKLHTEL